MERLLITGAAGGLGRVLREKLRPFARKIRLSDIADLGAAAENEELVSCDLGDEAAVMDLVAGCDGILHLGGISVEQSFEKILNGNLRGVYNLYEAARAHGHPRIIFASSNHTIGFYPQTTRLTADMPMKPDGLYGVSKCFGEAMASMYHSKFGQETAIVRIGSCFEQPLNHRMLSTWMSHDDFVDLIQRCFTAPKLGCPIIWGVSDNDCTWWDNSSARYLGWRPQSNSEVFRAALDAKEAAPPVDHPNAAYQGGMFTQDPIHKD
ncbi:NAD-dependent epimerase/dehydratase family protein [Falsirhodobacter halotolerans]|uniref:NAD-dependent epimerase/dehydratase family protein n=1 Tax=Falsirhodobacter halotolerans TaxID=1146892 RepID=UPI001FD26D2A|nr:NAD(P)-dependent oxidoreductase [Falsirhodobacter halotolerans]MCJ8139614.1 NAD(P)-dependent oxidoreductase [Falsirhodobacter halotolerans]